jgi:hypothetical protein
LLFLFPFFKKILFSAVDFEYLAEELGKRATLLPKYLGEDKIGNARWKKQKVKVTFSDKTLLPIAKKYGVKHNIDPSVFEERTMVNCGYAGVDTEATCETGETMTAYGCTIPKDKSCIVKYPSKLTRERKLAIFEGGRIFRKPSMIGGHRGKIELKPLSSYKEVHSPEIKKEFGEKPMLKRRSDSMRKRSRGRKLAPLKRSDSERKIPVQKKEVKKVRKGGLTVPGNSIGAKRARQGFGRNEQLKGDFIWAMDEQKQLYITPFSWTGQWHHSSFVAGMPVICAGTMKLDNGKVKEITNQSGHYQPKAMRMYEFLRILLANGISLSAADDVKIVLYVSDDESTLIETARNYHTVVTEGVRTQHMFDQLKSQGNEEAREKKHVVEQFKPKRILGPPPLPSVPKNRRGRQQLRTPTKKLKVPLPRSKTNSD